MEVKNKSLQCICGQNDDNGFQQLEIHPECPIHGEKQVEEATLPPLWIIWREEAHKWQALYEMEQTAKKIDNCYIDWESVWNDIEDWYKEQWNSDPIEANFSWESMKQMVECLVDDYIIKNIESEA